jgi:hypothetical protein
MAMADPESAVLMLLREMRSEMVTKNDRTSVKSELKNEIADVHSEVRSLRADFASDLMTLEKGLSDRISHLNRAVMEYHSSAVGHGMFISEFEERLLRVEQHLKLSPHDAH